MINFSRILTEKSDSDEDQMKHLVSAYLEKSWQSQSTVRKQN